MTTNQIAWYSARNTAEHNAGMRRLEESKLAETVRSNQAREAETARSNRANEAETFRANQARELETYRANTAKEAENTRANKANEALTAQRNQITLTTETNKLNEQIRANKEQEAIAWDKNITDASLRNRANMIAQQQADNQAQKISYDHSEWLNEWPTRQNLINAQAYNTQTGSTKNLVSGATDVTKTILGGIKLGL